MNRSTIRTFTRRILQEDTEDQFSDSVLNDYINFAYQWVEEQVLAVDGEAFVYIDNADIVSGQRYYAKPVNMLHELFLEYSETPSNEDSWKPLNYTSITLMKNPMLERYVHPELAVSTEKAEFTHVGGWYYLGWTPPANISGGLQVIYVPSLVMGADTDIPELHTKLHYAVVLAAAIFALGETPEDTGRLQGMVKALTDQIPRWYHKTLAGPEPVAIDARGNY